MDTPAGLELREAIKREIQETGEARCLSRIVDKHCTMEYSYAVTLLIKHLSRWGLTKVRVREGRSTIVKLLEAENDKG